MNSNAYNLMRLKQVEDKIKQSKRRHGVTLMELLMIVIIIGVITLVTVPRFNMTGVRAVGGEAFVRKIMTDLRKTRQLAIANGADNTNGYSLQIVGANPNQTYKIVNLKTSQTLETFTIASSINCQGDTVFSFTRLGALTPAAAKQMTITCQSKIYTIDVYAITGAVKCTGL